MTIIERYNKFPEERKDLFNFYLTHVENINNWDLVDLSAPQIVGRHLYDYPNFTILENLAASKHLWSERIAIVAQYYFIKRGDFKNILWLATKFLTHKHDLIHKALGWMLREVGKQELLVLENFLAEYLDQMPRVTLRYAIERFAPEVRAEYLKKKIKK